MPDIIFYIVTGFFFLKTFHFVALKKNSSDVEHILTASLVAGFTICKIMEFIPWSISPTIDAVGIICTGIVLGYLLGLPFQYNQIIYKICELFHLRNSINDYIWDDLTDWSFPNRIKVYYSDKTIEGYVHYTENYSNTPVLTLAGYIIKDKQGVILSNNSSNKNQVIFLELSKAEYVEIQYDSRSSMCNEIKELVSNNPNP